MLVCWVCFRDTLYVVVLSARLLNQYSPSRAARLACSHSVPPGRAQREPRGYAGLTKCVRHGQRPGHAQQAGSTYVFINDLMNIF